MRGRIVFNGQSSSVECTVRDTSETGARLLVSGSVTIPGAFELEIPKTGARRPVELVWTKPECCGVQFVEDRRPPFR